MNLSEISKHDNASSLWVIIYGKVYDLTKFAALHPGGRNVLLRVAGKDATKEFQQYHLDTVLSKYSNLSIGEYQAIIPREISIQYAEAPWMQGFNSPYYTKSHLALAKAVRKFVDEEMMPHVFDWEEKREVPQEFRKRCAEVGLLKTGVGKWPEEYAGKYAMDIVPVDEYDVFHSIVLTDAMNRCGSFGVTANLFGFAIALPPILKFGSQYLKDKVAKEVLEGDKMICLCITEPSAGSDVQSIKTTAVKTPDGKHYIVNGEKKFITSGIWCEYFTVACKTEGGISLFLLERSFGGITTRRMTMQGSWASGTTYCIFDNVKVPAENLIGKENNGFLYVMYNFNSERFGIIIQALRFARNCYEDAFTYAHKRKTFGKKLIENDVIRTKLGQMISSIEGCYAWTEQVAYQMKTMTVMEQNLKLNGILSLLKVQATQVLEMCASQAVQIFGGLGYTRGGQAGRVERIYRDVKVLAIGGGSEEIMTDFAIRQAIKQSKL